MKQMNTNYQKVTIEEIKKAICDMQFVPGMKELLEYLKTKKDQVDVIIISDSNNIFLEWFLEKNKVLDCISKIYTNPATIEKDSFISLKPYQINSCKICPPNLCKFLCIKEFLEQKIKEQITYEIKIYTGDGENDFCPITNLDKNDYAFPRKGYKIESKIQENENKIKATFSYWINGIDLIEKIKKILH